MRNWRVTISNCPYRVKDIPAKNKADARDRAFEFLMAVVGVDYTDCKVLKIEEQVALAGEPVANGEG